MSNKISEERAKDIADNIVDTIETVTSAIAKRAFPQGLLKTLGNTLKKSEFTYQEKSTPTSAAASVPPECIDAVMRGVVRSDGSWYVSGGSGYSITSVPMSRSQKEKGIIEKNIIVRAKLSIPNLEVFDAETEILS